MSELIKSEYAIFTACNLAYLPKALVLAESLLKNGEQKLKIYVIDRKCDVKLPVDLAEFIWIEDAEVPDLMDLAFRYDVTEFSTSIKPYIALRLLEKFQKVIFMDPDTCIYRPLSKIIEILDNNSVVLTPHYTNPHQDDGDQPMMRFGSFNLGFFAVSHKDEGLRFLRWWSDRCFRFCYFETQFGLSTDQKWVSIAPCFFRDLHILFDLGFNVAFWNMHERSLSCVGENDYLVNDEYPLVFFHFSAFDAGNTKSLSKRPFNAKNTERTDWFQLSADYAIALKRHSISASERKYGFDFMSNGDFISPTLRRAYASVCAELPVGHDPFDANGPVGAFAKKNFLIEPNVGMYKAAGYGDMGQHQTKFATLNVIMRLILRVLGPNRFADFSRLLVYLSSYRQIRSMWKI